MVTPQQVAFRRLQRYLRRMVADVVDVTTRDDDESIDDVETWREFQFALTFIAPVLGVAKDQIDSAIAALEASPPMDGGVPVLPSIGAAKAEAFGLTGARPNHPGDKPKNK